MAETNIAFSKIVSTPTPTAWSQAYSAGKVFAAISLESEETSQEEDHLSSIGKDFISTFESEFFTLEQKNLETIKQALNATISKTRDGVKLSLSLCFLDENVLYLFATGGGKAVLKRGDKIGTVLEGDNYQEVKPASGYVQENDVIILETKPFLKIISPSTLASALESTEPNEITESLAPHVHETSEGGAASVILMYRKTNIEPVALPSEDKPEVTDTQEAASSEAEDEIIPIEDLDENDGEDIEEENEINEPVEEIKKPEITEETEEDEEFLQSTPKPEALQKPDYIDDLYEPEQSDSVPFVTEDKFIKKRPALRINIRSIFTKLPKERRRLLTIAAGLIIVILIISVLAINRSSSTQNNQLFTKVLSEAKSKYDEGQNLKDLNVSLSQDSFKQARDLLLKNEDTFKNNSAQEKQIKDLLSKINSEITNTGPQTASTKEADKSVSKILSAELDNTGSYFSENDNNIVFLTSTGVSQIDKGNNEKTQIIKKDWITAGGIGTFGSNIYILDKASGILKFVPSEDIYSKTDYFVSDAPDLTSSVSMAIDGSVYILFKDGSIQKYTRGKADKFTLSGLDKPLSSSTKLFTNDGLDNLYAMDTTNSRIVVLGKDGTYKASYSSDVIKKAKDIDVKESDKKAYVLSGEKVYQIDLK